MSNLNAPVSSKSTCRNNAEYLYEQETPFGSITLFSKNTATFYESKDLSDLTPRAVNTLITLPEQMLCLWGYRRISSFLPVQVRELPALLLEQFYVYKWSMTYTKTKQERGRVKTLWSYRSASQRHFTITPFCNL